MSRNVTKILYEYNDAAIPPPYHRSYKITVTPSHCYIVVHTYGEIILEKHCIIEPDIWEKLAKDALELPAQSLTQTDDPPDSVGGSSRLITLYSGDRVIFKATVLQEACEESARLASFAHILTSLCPDFAEDSTSHE